MMLSTETVSLLTKTTTLETVHKEQGAQDAPGRHGLEQGAPLHNQIGSTMRLPVPVYRGPLLLYVSQLPYPGLTANDCK
jgi:hypothetical protein